MSVIYIYSFIGENFVKDMYVVLLLRFINEIFYVMK